MYCRFTEPPKGKSPTGALAAVIVTELTVPSEANKTVLLGLSNA